MLKSKTWKNERKLEGARLTKAFKAVGQWTEEFVEACEEAANRWLGVAQGTNDDELRARTWKNETPVAFDLSRLSPAVYMPC